VILIWHCNAWLVRSRCMLGTKLPTIVLYCVICFTQGFVLKTRSPVHAVQQFPAGISTRPRDSARRLSTVVVVATKTTSETVRVVCATVQLQLGQSQPRTGLARRILLTGVLDWSLGLPAWLFSPAYQICFSCYANRYASAVLSIVILSVRPSVCHTRSLWLEIYLSLTNHPGQLSLAIPPCIGE